MTAKASSYPPPIAETLAQQAADLIQNAILVGDLVPDGRLTIPALAERFAIGITPVREGLSRLAARGLVSSVGNRGFRVAPMSEGDLRDITGSRYEVEAAALRLSMTLRHDSWEGDLVAAFHRLKRVIGRNDEPISEDRQDYETAHRGFHHALIAGCGLPSLVVFQRELYDRAFRYRRVMGAKGLDQARALREHQILIDLALKDDPEKACAALQNHLYMTMASIYEDAQPT